MPVPTVMDVQKQITPILKSFGVRRAVLFGSIAKGNATEHSDLDLMVDSGLRGFDFIELGESVRLAVNRSVDIIDVTHIQKGSKIEHEIMQTGVTIYG